MGSNSSPGGRNWIAWLIASPAAFWAAFNLFKAARNEGELLREFSAAALNGVLLFAGMIIAWYALADLVRRVPLNRIPRLRTTRGVLAGILIGLAIRGFFFAPPSPSASDHPSAEAHGSPSPSQFPRTTTPAPTATPTATQTPPAPPTTEATSTPERPPLNGTCDRAAAPCLYYDALSWAEVAVFLFSTAERCRWPEIADLNRDASGRYTLPLPEMITLYVPPAARPETHPSMIRVSDGKYSYIPSCSETQTKPCVFTVPDGVYGSSRSAYAAVAALAYGRAESIDASKIMGANLASDCTGASIYLQPGITLVIPK